MQLQPDGNRSDSEPQAENEPWVFPTILDQPESVAGGPRNRGVTATDSAQVIGLCVTPDDPISNLEGRRFLACGVDSLDVGLYVRWGEEWAQQTVELEEGKAKAAGTEGITMNDGQFLILPSGKRPSYRFHLQWAEFHLFLSCSREPQKDTPNAYVSINSETLWRNGMEGALALVVHEIESLGGDVLSMKPSRCDLAADFLIPGGIPHALLLSLRFPSFGEHVHHMKDGREETFYQGSKNSPVQMRIYDKGLEVLRGRIKLWFLDVWKLSSCDSVWRVEFQIRRPYLKAFGIDTIANLRRALPGLWKNLTENWFSLRLHDNNNVTRRTIHPWWLDVQCCDVRFGEPQPLLRTETQSPADADWFVAHSAGCFLSYAALRRLGNRTLAAREFLHRILAYWERKDFGEAYAAKSIQLGFVNCVDVPTAVESDRREAA